MTANLVREGSRLTGPDGLPDEPLADPRRARSRSSSTRSGAASRGARRRGSAGRSAKAPTDLIVYQEIVQRVRPDWIIETGTGNGGRALFLASICELLDHGQVISIDCRACRRRPEHPRITYV